MVVQHGQFIMLLGKRGSTLAAPLLFEGEVAGGLPVEVRAVGIIQGAVIVPRSRAEDSDTVAVTTGGMAGRECAAIGNQQESWRVEVFLQEGELLGDGRVAVVVAIAGMDEDRHSAVCIDGDRHASVDNLAVVGGVTESDVGGWIIRPRSL